jgi:hypothetical protein
MIYNNKYGVTAVYHNGDESASISIFSEGTAADGGVAGAWGQQGAAVCGCFGESAGVGIR